jgi:hypothetical protein
MVKNISAHILRSTSIWNKCFGKDDREKKIPKDYKKYLEEIKRAKRKR